ncbi:MAG: hypothetical protein SEPTF4163_004765 [Sporothrix epigloea]
MAYDGGYAPKQQQRPYNGPAAPRPAPQRQYPGGQLRNGPGGGGGAQYGAYGRGDFGGGGYGGTPDYGGGYDPQGYGYDDSQGGYGGPGRGARPPMPTGRGGPAPRQMTVDNGGGRAMYNPRGGGPGPGPTRGGYQNGPPNRRPDHYGEQQMMDGLAGMDISGNRHPGGRGGPLPMRGPIDGRGYGPSRGPPQRSHTQVSGYGNQEYGLPPARTSRDDNFGPPGRTMTMPTSMDPMGGRGPPPQRNGGPYQSQNGAVGPGSGVPGSGMMLPQRPSTAQGTRPPPTKVYPDGVGNPGFSNGSVEPDRRDERQRPSSIDDFYDTYYNARDSGDYSGAANEPQQESQSFLGQDQYTYNNGGMEGSGYQRDANKISEISRAKSQPDLRQSQATVFEMAGDIPPMPTSRSGGFQQQGGMPSDPVPARQGSSASAGSGSINDSLSTHSAAHPAPVRPGLMLNSITNQHLNNRPPPVRNYNGGANEPMGTMSATPGQNQSTSQPPPMQASTPPNGPLATEAIREPPITPDMLEQLRNTVKADPNNQEVHLKLAKKLIEAIDILVPTLPDSRTRSKARERYAYDAHKLLKKLAAQQNGDAMFFMADCLGRGVFGQEPDSKEAFMLYQSAAKQGHPAAAYRTAVCCEIGNDEGGGTRKDPLKAMQWYKRAATLGDTPAMYKVGMIMLKGLFGQQRNPREAIGWLKRAAERADSENPHALHELGLLYESAQPNDVVLRDEAYAFQLFQQAADLGYKFSQFRLGCAYEYGLMGCPVDGRLSIMWYSKAATQEEHQSELALSGWYLTGAEGVLQQSDTEAYLWARKAATAGLAKAEYAMGYFTETGIGVAANLEDAKRWYWRAAAQDLPKARERLEDLKRSGKTGPRQRERFSRSKMARQQEGECLLM